LARLEVTARGSKRHQVCFCIISFFSRSVPGKSIVSKNISFKNVNKTKEFHVVPILFSVTGPIFLKVGSLLEDEFLITHLHYPNLMAIWILYQFV
jgi:hypothetical protein